MKHDPIPTQQVLTWLHATHPDLIDTVELDRAWCWVTADLRDKPDVRQSLKDYGFVFARRGHALPSGASGTWGHSCEAPLPFKRRDRGNNRGGPKPRATNPEPRKRRSTKPEPAAAAGGRRFDPLAHPTPPPVPAPKTTGALDQTLNPELLAWLS